VLKKTSVACNVVTNHVRWANYMSRVANFLQYIGLCAKITKLAGSRQSYCKNNQAYFLAHPVQWLLTHMTVAWTLISLGRVTSRSMV